MSLEGFLLGVLYVLAWLNWPVTAILFAAALRPPRVRFLMWATAASFVISLVVTLYSAVTATETLGVPIEAVVLSQATRVVLTAVGVLPVVFLWMFATGRFRDRE